MNPHTSETGIIVKAFGFKNFLNEIIKGMQVIMFEEPQKSHDGLFIELDLKEKELEDFIFEFMNQFIYIFNVKKLVFVKVGSVKPFFVYCKRFDHSKHKTLTEIKAVTRHEFKVKKLFFYYTLKVIFDV